MGVPAANRRSLLPVRTRRPVFRLLQLDCRKPPGKPEAEPGPPRTAATIGRPVPAVAGETVTLELGAMVARDLADALRSGARPVQVKRGGRVVVPADAVQVAQQVAERYGLTYPLDPQSAVVEAVSSWVAAQPELDDATKGQLRAALRLPDGRSGPA